ncbi:alpha/beta-hydrolase [Metschnikowia bicuspidata var. bicuspidata NRRL YB-4993]|uniref:Alpha/beta-hydrolase n=1 Tax=Metschnikowia bicuspidata var. bicuspidata NRRL YB-4993 TaxID=869754 RepID=A0A1A0HEB5_9ASCO|nr:alpha/beta-hydrolase [Metschnikowia bicuspidata var. bicuspidata NRRL YB-4993]OBA22330.1 alpha/beta-hydrolase [Metschnikowia bicuspidata var. bicuspidata NRRL YB-4993]
MVHLEKKQTQAYWPRGPGSYVSMTDKLDIVYLKYTSADPVPQGCTTVNFIFAHGTGMNKSLWKRHIEELYGKNKSCTGWKVGCVLSVDAVGHGDSALINKEKISWANDWRDGAKDLIETTGDFLPSAYTRNIVVGHSMGGFHATYASFLEPTLFDACVAIEPVIFIDQGANPLAVARMKKIGLVLRDQFASRADADAFFQKGSFYRVMDPRVLADFTSDELHWENGQLRTKATKDAQLAAYLSAVYSVRFGQNILLLLEVPYLLITGEQAAWNSPKSDRHIEKSVSSHLLETVKLRGDHLVHALNVGDTVDAIYSFAGRRAEFVASHRNEFPEVKLENSAGARVKAMFKHMWKGDMDKAFRWDRPEAKL